MRIRVALTWLCALAGLLMGIANLAAQTTASSGAAPADPIDLALAGAFGEQGVTDIIFTLGYYGMVSMLLNVDEHPLPAGVQVELKPLGH